VTLYWALTAMGELSNQIQVSGPPVPGIGSPSVGARPSKFAVAVLALAAMLLTAAPLAGAEDEDGVDPFHAFALQGSNGYRIDVWAVEFEPADDGEVVILVTRKGRSAGYVVPATVTETRIDADLGEVGRIALELVPTGGKASTPICEPDDRFIYDKGHYVGEFEFRGEEGFTRVQETRIAYLPGRIIDFLCGADASEEVFGHGLPGARLTAHARLGKERVSLQINQNWPGGSVRVRASVLERRDGILIEREVGGTDPGRAFEFGGHGLSFAAARPDAPFSGTGTFGRGAKPSNRWTGNLEVDFPGRRNVPLTGDRFRAKLIHARLTQVKIRDRPNLRPWLSTKPSPNAFGTFSPLALK
jgi:hypothetical protein